MWPILAIPYSDLYKKKTTTTKKKTRGWYWAIVLLLFILSEKGSVVLFQLYSLRSLIIIGYIKIHARYTVYSRVVRMNKFYSILFYSTGPRLELNLICICIAIYACCWYQLKSSRR